MLSQGHAAAKLKITWLNRPNSYMNFQHHIPKMLHFSVQKKFHCKGWKQGINNEVHEHFI